MTPCEEGECASHKYLEETITKHYSDVARLTEITTQMQIQLGILMERLTGQERIHVRLNNLETKLDEHSKLLWKAIGGATIIAVFIPMAFRLFFH